MSGPDDDYEGTLRKALGDVTQLAVYTGYKKCHGLKVETLLLSNGISTVLDPHQPISTTLAVCFR